MTPDDPRHGTNAGATQHLADGEPLCDACHEGRWRYNKAARHDRANGRPREIRLGKTAHAIAMRGTTGWMAELTGLHRELIRQTRLNGPDAMVYRTTRDTLLAAAPHATWTCVGVQRRLRGLVALGWTARDISRTADVSEPSVYRVLRTDNPARMRAEIAIKLIDAYNQLADQPAPVDNPWRQASVTKSTQRAHAKGWVVPAMWDDIDTDTAPAAVNKNSSRPEIALEEYAHLINLGESPEQAANILGLTLRTIEDYETKARKRANSAA